MVGELALRFVVGGAIVALFAVVSEIVAPKTFAGVFGAAPSVALATLAIALATRGPAYAAVECRSMIAGGVAMVAYGAACASIVGRRVAPVWVEAGACWLVWVVVAFGVWSAIGGVTR